MMYLALHRIKRMRISNCGIKTLNLIPKIQNIVECGIKLSVNVF